MKCQDKLLENGLNDRMVSASGFEKRVEEIYDVVVVGAGHAGCEAALAAARMGMETIMFTVSVDRSD